MRREMRPALKELDPTFKAAPFAGGPLVNTLSLSLPLPRCANAGGRHPDLPSHFVVRPSGSPTFRPVSQYREEACSTDIEAILQRTLETGFQCTIFLDRPESNQSSMLPVPLGVDDMICRDENSDQWSHIDSPSP